MIRRSNCRPLRMTCTWLCSLILDQTCNMFPGLCCAVAATREALLSQVPEEALEAVIQLRALHRAAVLATVLLEPHETCDVQLQARGCHRLMPEHVVSDSSSHATRHRKTALMLRLPAAARERSFRLSLRRQRRAAQGTGQPT